MSYEESPLQIQRNTRSIGIRLEPWVANGLLKICALRSTSHGLEAHLALLHKTIREFQPTAVVGYHGERNRALYILKARGTAHSNQVREFLITAAGVELLEPYIAPAGVLTGTARMTQENRERAELKARAGQRDLSRHNGKKLQANSFV